MDIKTQEDFKSALLALAKVNFHNSSFTIEEYELCEMALEELSQLIPDLSKQFDPTMYSFLSDVSKNEQIEAASTLKKQLESIGFSTQNAHEIAYGRYTHLSLGSYVSGHYTSKLGNWIRPFYNIRYIDAYCNKFKEIPAIIRDLPNVEVLHFGINRIRTLPTWLYDLPNLKRLIIGGNPIKPKVLADFIKNAPPHLRQPSKNKEYGIFNEVEDLIN